MANTKVGIIGRGNVGSALQRGLSEAGYEVRTVGDEPGKLRDVGVWADSVILAVPFAAREDAVGELGDAIAGKTLVDVTNALSEDMSFEGDLDLSGAEEVQRFAGKAHVVKAFNTVFAHHMDKGGLDGQPLTVFVAGDQQGAKSEVIEMAEAIGFDVVDAGPLERARYLEPMAYLHIALAMRQGYGGEVGFHYIHGERADDGHARPAASQTARSEKRAKKAKAPHDAPPRAGKQAAQEAPPRERKRPRRH